jgi:CRP-like cAMP-binding protein
VLAKAPEARQDAELGPVLRVLQKVEFTAALESTVLRELARFVRYESYPDADHTVVKQGDPGALFYIILSGDGMRLWQYKQKTRTW